MATATAPAADRERLEIIWRTITRDVAQYADESGISTVNSRRWNKINRTLEELAAMLVDEVSDWAPKDPDDRSDVSLLTTATEDIWRYIEDRLLDWAVAVETRRTARRERAA